MKKATLISATLVTALSAFAFAPATYASMESMEKDKRVIDATIDSSDAHTKYKKAEALAEHTGKADDHEQALRLKKHSNDQDDKLKAAVMKHERNQGVGENRGDMR